MKTLKEFRIQVNEVLKSSDPIEKWIDDFVHSKNPKFAGKSTKERIEMAKGAYYGAQKNEVASISQNSIAVPDMEAVEYKGIGTDVVDKKKKLNPQPNLLSTKKTVKDFKEEVEELDELDKKTIGSYAKKATKDLKWQQTMRPFDTKRIQNREKGIDTAIDKLTKEEVKKSTGDLKKACWKGYTAVGLKMKNGRKVPNCVPEEVQVEEGKVYDPITKKMVATKPIKVQAGGGATRNGVPVETGPSKYKQSLKKEEVQIDEISKQTADSYLSKVTKDQVGKHGMQPNMFDKLPKNRQQGVSNALKRLISPERPSRPGDIHGKSFTEEVQIDEVSKSTLMRYIPKASRDVADHVAMAKERQVTMAHATHAGNYDMAKKESEKSKISFKKAMQRMKGIDTATKKLGTQKEEVEHVDEAIAKKLPVQHAVNAVHKTLGSKAATRFLGHLKPGTEKHTSWDKVNSALMKQGVQTKHIASIAQKTSHENVDESRGHKTLATFFKNREVAQRAFQGNPAKDAEVAQGGGTPADQGIAAAKKDAEKLKKESVNPALMAILKKRQEAQKKKEEDKKKVNEAMTPAVHAAEPKRTKSTSKTYANVSVPGTKRVTGSKSDNNEPGEQIKEDQYTSEYKIKYYVDPITGENKTRKIRPHKVNFANSKMRGEPSQQDAQGDYGMKEGYVAEGGFDNYHEIAKELIKRHGKNVNTGHINDIAGERDTHRGLDHSEVMHHVNKLNKDVKEGEEYDEMWKEYKGKSFKKEQRMLNFNDYLKEAWQEGAGKAKLSEKELSAKQKKIASIAGDKDKIDAHDLAALRAGKKPVEEAKKCMDEDDMDESGLRMAAHAAHKSGKKEFEFNGKTYPVKVQKEEVEQIDELSKKTLGSYVNKAAKDSRIHGQIATDFENTADKARKQSKKDSFERLNRKYLSKAWKREDGIKKAVDKLTKEEVELDEGKMKELSMDLTDMGHDEFNKKYGKPKSHYDATNFKKPVEPGKGMDRAKALAQRGLKSMSEQLEEATTRKDFQMVADLIKGHESADKRKELATHHAGIFKKQNPRFDHAKFMKAAGVNEETDSEYLKATLAFMDESKYDDYKDALRAKKATQSAFDKDFKSDTTHPHIQVVKGTQYGGENQKDDEGDEKPEADKEKRGRGRPSGSKSGARLKGGGHEDGGIPVHNLHLPKSHK